MKACWRWNNKCKWSSWNTWTSAMMIILSSANNNEKKYLYKGAPYSNIKRD